ncbi:MAG: TPR domain protein, putative component of TonB system [Candidatus Ozemobacter sibiricus]|jgi:predicted O-linked N-acetylglucosamine transferase (SPINDLY family)|uniref:protein O-GlcNAc transferase n=1 Tax=Candidatus Ozemobacter sibiricus TaxID=2268124 RepID=A0A367ZNX6_9BACT|nr:MAG: TPR domain protein, putative component of TonB system [Candidatus Ozemobacter sibiricus]
MPFSPDSLPPLDRALALLQQGRRAEAEPLFRQALALEPTNLAAAYSLTVLLLQLDRLEEALEQAQIGTRNHPTCAPLWHVLGQIWQRLGRPTDALAAYDQALVHDPTCVDVLINSSALLHEQRQYKEALLRLHRAVEADPSRDLAWANYGILLSEFKQTLHAIHAFEQLVLRNPDYPFGLGLLTFERLHLCDWRDFSWLSEQIISGVRAGRKTCKTLAFMALSDDAGDVRRCTEIYTAHQHPHRFPPLWRGETYSHARLRVAYVSPDFRDHPVGHLLAGVLEGHDHTRVETYGISLGENDGSRHHQRIVAALDHFYEVLDKTPAQIAALIRSLDIDVAVDLAGYTAGSRTDIFLHRPAPVQVNYLGYAGTMGLPCYDFILADAQVIPPNARHHYSEQVFALPHCYLPVASGCPPAVPLPRAAYGLPDQAFVFCAFGHDYKIHPEIFRIWMKLLQAIPGSVLWLMSRHETTIANLRQAAHHHQIDPARLVFASRVPRIEDHLARYQVADLFLDPWPYGSHTTSADALMVGLPVITYQGGAFHSRVASSLLTTLGLPELITHSFEEYFTLACKLAKDRNRLATYRQRLQAIHPPSLLSGRRFAASLEEAFAAMLADRLPRHPALERFMLTANASGPATSSSQPAPAFILPSENPNRPVEHDSRVSRSSPRLVIVVPIYKPTLNLLEQFSLDQLKQTALHRTITFVGPRHLDVSYYRFRYPEFGIRLYDDRYFASIQGYNHLLLDPDFYAGFDSADFVLIHQTDALLLHDDLDQWMHMGYDYVGAPWPGGLEILLQFGRYARHGGLQVKAYVGNGGFSLRSIRGTRHVLVELGEMRDYWIRSNSSEDLFFGFAGTISNAFRLPNQMVAARFALELEPQKFFDLHDGTIPTGCHAWWKHDLEFWKGIIIKVAEKRDSAGIKNPAPTPGF